LPFIESKAEVKLAEDISGYALRKVRILNGSHTAMTGLGLLNGIHTVGEWISDPMREKFLLEMIEEEIIPSMELDINELKKYAADVLDRFKNPFVSHKLSDISLNSTAKLKSRILPILEDYRKKFGALPSKLTLCLVSMILFYLRSPEKIRDTDEIKSWFENVQKTNSEKENLKLALKVWLDLNWNSDFESTYHKLNQ
jgi:tagaturonate reductase